MLNSGAQIVYKKPFVNKGVFMGFYIHSREFNGHLFPPNSPINRWSNVAIETHEEIYKLPNLSVENV